MSADIGGSGANEHEGAVLRRSRPPSAASNALPSASPRSVSGRDPTLADTALFESAFAYAAIGMALLDPKGRWLKANDSLCHIVGYSRAELYRTDFQSITHPGDLDLDLDLIERLVQGGLVSYDLEKRYLHKSGRVVWVLVTVSLVRTDAGAPQFFILQVQDITAAKNTAAEAKTFFDCSLDMLALAGTSGTLDVVNDSWERTLGWSRHELTTRPFLDFVHPDDRARTIAEAQAVYSNTATASFRNRYLAKDGTYRWLEWRTQPTTEGRLYCAVRDVTQEQEAAEALAASERRFRAVAEGSIQGILVRSIHDRRTLFANDAAARIFGFASGPVLVAYESEQTLLGAAEREHLRQRWDALRHGEIESLSDRLAMRKRDGSPIWVDLMACLLEWDGQPAHLVTLVDVTEKTQLEASLQASVRIYRTMARNLPNGAVFLFDHDLRYVLADGSGFFDAVGLPRGSMEGRLMSEFATEANRDEVERLYRSALEGVESMVQMKARGHEFELHTVPVRDEQGHITAGMALAYDVTERSREAEELRAARAQLTEQAAELRALSNTDALTGLLNRRGFLLLAEQQLCSTARRQDVSLLFIDLDGMKALNDRLGHEAGDAMLREAALVLKETCRDGDIAARLGGDEFVVLTFGNTSSASALRERLLANVDAANAANGRSYTLAMSIGESSFDPTAPQPLEALLAEADARMYAAKTSKRGEPQPPPTPPALQNAGEGLDRRDG